MADPIRTALVAARACIQQDRQALADSHTSIDGLDEDGAAGVAEYDEVLQQIEEALGALAAPGEEREAFQAWYVVNAFDYARDPIGSRDCALQWAAWHARAMLAARPSAQAVALTEERPAGLHPRLKLCPDVECGRRRKCQRTPGLTCLSRFDLAMRGGGKEGGA